MQTGVGSHVHGNGISMGLNGVKKNPECPLFRLHSGEKAVTHALFHHFFSLPRVLYFAALTLLDPQPPFTPLDPQPPVPPPRPPPPSPPVRLPLSSPSPSPIHHLRRSPSPLPSPPSLAATPDPAVSPPPLPPPNLLPPHLSPPSTLGNVFRYGG